MQDINLQVYDIIEPLMYFILIFMWKFIYDLLNFCSSKQVLNQLKSVWKRYWHWCLGQIYSIASVVAIIFIDILYHNMRKWASCGVRVESSDPYCCQTGLSLTYPRAAYELVGQWEAGIVSDVTTSPVSETAQPSQLISLGHLTYWTEPLYYRQTPNTCYLRHLIMDIDRVTMMSSDTHGSLLNRVSRWILSSSLVLFEVL